MGLILASVFFNLRKSTDTFYFRGGALFFSVLFNAFSSLLEILSLYEARPIVEKHRKYALYRPSADALASIISELPVKLLMTMSFNIVYYFMVNLRRTAGNFFFYWLMCIVHFGNVPCSDPLVLLQPLLLLPCHSPQYFYWP